MRIKLLGLFLAIFLNTFSQSSNESYYNPILTGVPFLEIPVNARIGGFAEIASVSSPFYQDAGLYQNPALLSKNARYAGGNLSYNPYLEKFSSDYIRTELSAFYAINESNAVAYNFTVFNTYEFILSDETGQSLGYYRTFNQFHQITYSHSFPNGISVGGGVKYIRSDLGFESVSGTKLKPANSFAIDLGFDYGKAFHISKIFTLNLNTGVAVNNFGTKINYNVNTANSDGPFLPTNLRFGILLNPDFKIDDHFTIGLDLAYQLDKLLVPTPPVYAKDSNGYPIPIPGTDKFEIEKGMDPDISIFRATYQSFYDAPYGFEEEMNEIIHKLATELRIDYQRKLYLAVRIGKYIEDKTKGGRNYITWGVGIGAYGFTMDFKKLKSDNNFFDGIWAFTFGFRTSITNPAFRF